MGVVGCKALLLGLRLMLVVMEMIVVGAAVAVVMFAMHLVVVR